MKYIAGAPNIRHKVPSRIFFTKLSVSDRPIGTISLRDVTPVLCKIEGSLGGIPMNKRFALAGVAILVFRLISRNRGADPGSTATNLTKNRHTSG
jgi:hypothetical protein